MASRSSEAGCGAGSRDPLLWGQAGITLLSGIQKAASPVVAVTAFAFILPAVIEHLLCAGLVWAWELLQWVRGAAWGLWGSHLEAKAKRRQRRAGARGYTFWRWERGERRPRKPA